MLAPNTYFSIFGTMQKAKYYIKENMAHTGLMRRFCIFSVEGIDLPNENWKPPLGTQTDDLSPLLDQLGKEIGQRMYTYGLKLKELRTKLPKNIDKKQVFLPLYYDKEVEKLGNEYARSIEIPAREDDENPFLLFQQNRFEHTMKFAGLLAVANGRNNVTIEDFNTCKKIIEHTTKSMEDTLYGTASSKKKNEHEKNRERLYQYIKKNRLDKRTIQMRMGRFGVKSKELELLYAKLKGDHRILEDGKKKSGWCKID